MDLLCQSSTSIFPYLIYESPIFLSKHLLNSHNFFSLENLKSGLKECHFIWTPFNNSDHPVSIDSNY